MFVSWYNIILRMSFYHTSPIMDMDLHDHRKVSMALALAAQNMDMSIPH